VSALGDAECVLVSRVVRVFACLSVFEFDFVDELILVGLFLLVLLLVLLGGVDLELPGEEKQIVEQEDGDVLAGVLEDAIFDQVASGCHQIPTRRSLLKVFAEFDELLTSVVKSLLLVNPISNLGHFLE